MKFFEKILLDQIENLVDEKFIKKQIEKCLNKRLRLLTKNNSQSYFTLGDDEE